jgi:Ca2+/Na+ antiporter
MKNSILELSEVRSETIREVNKEKDISNNIKKEEPTVGGIHEAPEFLRDNEFIHSGYRINFDSYWKILKSLFVLHNEFVNVWSHILGALFVVVLILYTAFYIKSHKLEIIDAIDHKLDLFNDTWSNSHYFQNLTFDLKHTYEEGKEKLNEYTSNFKNKTYEYLTTFDDKLYEYKEYFNEKIK